MLFLPFRADLEHFRFPWLTLLIALACVVVLIVQQQSDVRFLVAAEDFCRDRGPALWRMTMRRVGEDPSPAGCLRHMVKLDAAPDPERRLHALAARGRPLAGLDGRADRDYKYSVLAARFHRFEALVPRRVTPDLWYVPGSWDPWHMLTSVFAHADWGHLVGNLVFFFAFAASVEVLLGTLVYLLVFLGLALGTGVFYSLSMLGWPDAPPTLGLSGVVMGMMGLFAALVPGGRIRTLVWFLLFLRVVSIPAWVLVLVYAGLDAWRLFGLGADQGVNL
ncbi:MAG: rhomboid family intramembrane serine protease, partial [Gammaproteobacteria bacterium]